MENREKLREIMNDNQFTYNDIATILEVKLETVKSWLLPSTCKAFRNMPNHRIRSLRQKPRGDHG